MKTVHVQIARYSYDKFMEFDNVVSRDELIHDILSKNKDMKRDREGREFEWDNGVYLTWYDGDTQQAQLARAAHNAEAGTLPTAPTAPEAEGTDAG